MSDDFDDDEAQSCLVIDELGENGRQSANSSPQIDNLNFSRDVSLEPMELDDRGNGNVDGESHSAGDDRKQSDPATGSSTSPSKTTTSGVGDSAGFDSAAANPDKRISKSPANGKKRKMMDKSTYVNTHIDVNDLDLFTLQSGTVVCINIEVVSSYVATGMSVLHFKTKSNGKLLTGMINKAPSPWKSHEKASDNVAGTTAEPAVSFTATPPAKARGKRTPRVEKKKKMSPKDRRFAIIQLFNRGKSTTNIAKELEVCAQTVYNVINKALESHENDENNSSGGGGGESALGMIPSNVKLVDNEKQLRCLRDGCEHYFNDQDALKTHIEFTHDKHKRVILKEDCASQTLISFKLDGALNVKSEEELKKDAKLHGTNLPTPLICVECRKTMLAADAIQTLSQPDLTRVAAAADNKLTPTTAETHFRATTTSVHDNSGAAPASSSDAGNDESKRGAAGDNSAGALKDGNTPSAFSDISDDGAPTLEKEEEFERSSENITKKPKPIHPTTIANSNLNLINTNLSRDATMEKNEVVANIPQNPSALEEAKVDERVSNSSSTSVVKSAQDFVTPIVTTGNSDPASMHNPSLTSTLAALAAATAKNEPLTPAQQQQVLQFMSSFPAANQQQTIAAMLGAVVSTANAGGSGTTNAPGLPSSNPLYATPFQPNYQLNPSYFPMGISPGAAAASQPFAAGLGIAGKTPTIPGFPPPMGFGNPHAFAPFPSAANGLSSAIASTSMGTSSQGKQSTADHLNTQRHKLYELKNGPAQGSSPGINASGHLMTSPIASGSKLSMGESSGRNGADRLSATAMGPAVGGGAAPEAPIPLRPSSSSAVSNSAAMFKRPPTNSPNSSTTAAASLLTSGLPPNLVPSQGLQQMLLNQQQQQQQQHLQQQFRHLGLPPFLLPDQLAYAAAMQQMVANTAQSPFSQPSQAQQTGENPSLQQQFPHSSQQKQ